MKRIIPIILVSLFLCPMAHATMIRYDFAGTVTDIEYAGLTTGLEIGDGITGYFEYDDSQPIPHPAYPSQVKVEGEFAPVGFEWNATPTWFFDSWFETSTLNLYAFLPIWDGALDIDYSANSWRLVSSMGGWTILSGSLDHYSPAPEPTSFILMGLGVAAAGCRRFLKRKTN